MNGDTHNGDLTDCNKQEYIGALPQLYVDGSCMTPSLSSGSSASFCTSVMNVTNDDLHMAVAFPPYDSQEMTDETSPGLVSNVNYYDDGAGEQQYQYSSTWRTFVPPQNDVAIDPELYQDVGCEQIISDGFSKPEQPNFGNMLLEMPLQSYSPQSSMNVQTSKSYKSRPGQNGAPKRNCQCTSDGCGKSFSRTADLLRHNRHVHGDERIKQNIVCDYLDCPRYAQPFSRKDHYREHLREAHGEDMTKRGVNVHLASASLRKVSSSTSSRKDGRYGKGKQASKNEVQDGSLAVYLHDEGDRYAFGHGQGHSNGGCMQFEVKDVAFSCSTNGDVFADITADDNDEYYDNYDKPDPEEERLRNCIVDPSWWRCSRCLQRVPRTKEDDSEEDWKCPSCNVNIESLRRKIREEADRRAAALAASRRALLMATSLGGDCHRAEPL